MLSFRYLAENSFRTCKLFRQLLHFMQVLPSKYLRGADFLTRKTFFVQDITAKYLQRCSFLVGYGYTVVGKASNIQSFVFIKSLWSESSEQKMDPLSRGKAPVFSYMHMKEFLLVSCNFVSRIKPHEWGLALFEPRI